MNWMVDGVHGDLYRAAMGYPQLEIAPDELEIERRSDRKPRSVGIPFAGLIQRLGAGLVHRRETIRTVLTSKETVS